MEVVYDVKIKKLLPKEKSLLVNAVFRQALIEVGKSADYHVFNLTDEFLSHVQDKAAGRYLLSVKRFYESLDQMAKRVFLCEVLEYGRHYRFWFYEFATRNFGAILSNLYQAIDEQF